MNPQQIKIMLDLQDSMNTKVNANWQTQGYEWYRAIWVECAELLDHYGWKWWKHREADINQVKMEMVDIWHFLLSWIIISKINLEEVECILKEAFDGVKGDFLAEAYYFLKLY